MDSLKSVLIVSAHAADYPAEGKQLGALPVFQYERL
jgi:hypothetical protein